MVDRARDLRQESQTWDSSLRADARARGLVRSENQGDKSLQSRRGTLSKAKKKGQSSLASGRKNDSFIRCMSLGVEALKKSPTLVVALR